jgi:multidrug resistance protein, MATE family
MAGAMWSEKTSLEVKSLWKLALPLALAQAGQAFMGLVDTAILGRLSPAAQAGAGLGNSLAFTFTFFGIGVVLAMDPLISQAVGAKEIHKSHTLFRQGLWLAFFVSLAVVLISVLSTGFLDVFHVTEVVALEAKRYIFFRLPSVLGALFFVVTRSFLQSHNIARSAFVAMLVGNVANFFLDWIFVFGAGPIPAMGVAGAAVATSLCTWLQLAVLFLMEFPKSPAPVSSALHWPTQLRAFRLGLPLGIQSLAESGLFTVVGLLAGNLGEAESAAHQVCLTWASITFSITMGIGSAAATRVGLFIGAKKVPEARLAGHVALISSTVFMSLCSLLFILFPRGFARVMSNDEAVISVAASVFFVVAVFQVSDGLQAVGAGILRGAADTKFPSLTNIFGHWLVGLPVAYSLGVLWNLGITGLWWGLSAGLTAVAVVLVGRFNRVTKFSAPNDA